MGDCYKRCLKLKLRGKHEIWQDHISLGFSFNPLNAWLFCFPQISHKIVQTPMSNKNWPLRARRNFSIISPDFLFHASRKPKVWKNSHHTTLMNHISRERDLGFHSHSNRDCSAMGQLTRASSSQWIQNINSFL